MKLRIFITKNILEQSKMCGKDTKGLPDWDTKPQEIGQNCAIGKAIVNLFGTRACVGCYAIYINAKEHPSFEKRVGTLGVIPLPKEATSFIVVFDSLTPEERTEMTPFSFEIDVPQNVVDDLGLLWMEGVIKETETLKLV